MNRFASSESSESDSSGRSGNGDAILPPSNMAPPCDESWYKDLEKRTRVKGKNRVIWTYSRTGGFRTLLMGMGIPYEAGGFILAKASELLPSGPALNMALRKNKDLLDRIANTLHNDKKLSRWFKRQFLPAEEWKVARNFFKQAAYRWLLVANDRKKRNAEKAKRQRLRAQAQQLSHVEPRPDVDDGSSWISSSRHRSDTSSFSSVPEAWHGLDSSEGAKTATSKCLTTRL